MAPRAEYPEDWQLQCGELKQRGAHLLKSKLWSDCSFLVGEQPGQIVVKAHKLILAMASPVFEAMFYGPIAEGDNTITIPDIHPEIFESLLEYIYTDNIELDSFEKACSLYYGAQKYMLTHLLTVCTMYLSCNLTPEVACQMYEFALMVGEENLVRECEQMIISDTSSILLLKGFEEASLETVEKIFSMNNLNISSELDLFKAAERYLKVLNVEDSYVPSGTIEEKENSEVIILYKNTVKKENYVDGAKKDQDSQDGSNSDPPIHDNKAIEENENSADHTYCLTNSSSKEQNQDKGTDNKSIKKLVQQIRFLTLTPKELAEYPTLTSLLTESEILALMMNTASTNTHMPMPEGFSLSRTKRTLPHYKTKYFYTIMLRLFLILFL